MKIKLYYMPQTRAGRVRWILEELSLPYELKNIDLFAGEGETPEYKKMKSYHSAVDITLNLAVDLFNISGSPVHLTKTIMNLIANGAESISGKGIICIETQ